MFRIEILTIPDEIQALSMYQSSNFKSDFWKNKRDEVPATDLQLKFDYFKNCTMFNNDRVNQVLNLTSKNSGTSNGCEIKFRLFPNTILQNFLVSTKMLRAKFASRLNQEKAV